MINLNKILILIFVTIINIFFIYIFNKFNIIKNIYIKNNYYFLKKQKNLFILFRDIKFISILYLILIIYIYFKYNNYYKYYFFIIINIILGQLIKFIIKYKYKIKRPYLLFNKNIYNNYFIYNDLKKYFKFFKLKKYFLKNIFNFIIYNNNYSFPSGHTIYIYSLFLNLLFFTNINKFNLLIYLIYIIWFYFIIFYKLFYNLHRYIDIIFSIIISLIIFIFLYYIFNI